MSRTAKLVLSVLSTVPLAFAYLFYQAGQYDQAYWLAIIPSVLAIIIVCLTFVISEMEGIE